VYQYLPEGWSVSSCLNPDLVLRVESEWFTAVEDTLGGGSFTLLGLEEAALLRSDWGEIFETGVVVITTPAFFYTECRGSWMPVVVGMPLNPKWMGWCPMLERETQ
jgi:hypothetical protein